MRKLIQNFSILFIIAGILILSTMLYKQLKIAELQTIAPVMEEESMQQLKIYNYDEQGKIKNLILAKHWEFIPTKKYSFIIQPTLWMYRQPNYFYKITGQQAYLLHTTINKHPELIKLFTNVIVEQRTLKVNYQSLPEFTLTTSYLEFDPQTELASTKSSVAIYKPGLVIKGIGMTADLKRHELDLHHNVSSEYNKPEPT